MALSKEVYSPYRRFSVKEWSALSQDKTAPLTARELEELQGYNEKASMREVEEIYLPLSRLLSLYVGAVQGLNREESSFLGGNGAKIPFIIGLAGSVAVGKSTTARILQTLLARWPGHPKVDLITTDGFLHPNAKLVQQGIMNRKGFPESYDRAALLAFLSDIKSGRRQVRSPVYSHLVYDVVPDQWLEVDQPDILIVEGLNVLQTGRLRAGEPHVFISDYFDFSIYLDADEALVEEWYIQRFLELRKTAFTDPRSYFRNYASLSEEEAVKTATRIWHEINLKNLHENIQPTRERARLILHKGADHMIDEIFLRKL
ncbi:type I pantothenate kinase [Aestuariispira insulae]|uniref:Pantothenate kinase n=1 Tax=Aestuariispira insulae TaxID=1461337 RepID=A0A3D9HF01_9PROT|nr:type I pantothenate kinase [Aestuariispira insulae]RED48054.1 pantothenate kinase [Aestuariispira insulae]